MKNCQPTSRVNLRDSNLELLRIVAMATNSPTNN